MIWSTPSGRQLVDTLQRELEAGLNSVCYLPKPLLEDNFLALLSDRLYFAGRNKPVVSTVYPLGDGTSPSSLADLLRSHWRWNDEALSWTGLDETWVEEARLEDLFHATANDDCLKYLALTGLENLPAEAQRSVAKDLSVWAALTQQSQMSGPTPAGLRLLILATPGFPDVRTNLFLSAHRWWAMTGDIDRLAGFDELARRDNLDREPLVDRWWLQSLCQGFCRDDFALMRLIFRDRPKTLEEIVETLKSHPLHEASHRYRPKMAKAPAQPPQILGEKPRVPKDGLYRELWAAGLLFTDPQISLNPVLMDEDQLGQAIGLGQRQLLLPLVDQMLSLLKEAIEKIFGTGVWIANEHDVDKRADLVTEISPLAFFIRDKLPQTGRFTGQAWSTTNNFAFAWRGVRHTVSHNRMLPYGHLAKACSHYHEFHRLLVWLHQEDDGAGFNRTSQIQRPASSISSAPPQSGAPSARH